MSSRFPVSEVHRQRIVVRGVVQGVGFRPFVHKLARTLELSGFVRNSPAGVVIEAEGLTPALERLLESIRTGPPPLAEVDEIAVAELPLQRTPHFTIEETTNDGRSHGLAAPDVALCDRCRDELHDPDDRRFGYPFVNCTNCGPRYTIMRALPYDRVSTTMSVFPMCPRCHAEYEDPGDRRFHAQPNACPDCGPGLHLLEAGSSAPGRFEARDTRPLLQRVQQLLAAGSVVAIRGVGGFHLACDARSDAGVAQLRRLKHRVEKPFALMARDLPAAERLCVMTPAERSALLGAERPIVVMERRSDSGLSDAIAPGNRTAGVMLPYAPLHELLFHEAPFDCLVMTSANRSEEPIVTANDVAMRELGPHVEAILMHDRDIHMRADDSVVRTFEGRPRLLRRSRGYAPRPIDLGEPAGEILACGAELKNTLCLTRDHHAILSQHIGDLSTFEAMRFFEETLANLKRLFRVDPQIVAHDLHPHYATTRYACSLSGVETIGVQHHHAHIASCMADNGIRGRVIGVAMDGTGYGTDGAIWGGEFLTAGFDRFERRAHLRYVPLAGGDAAVRQPWRPALSHLRDAFESDMPRGLPLFAAIPERDRNIVETMIARGLNSVPTSSCGRLFDAVASIIGVRHQVDFEAQAAIDLEMLAATDLDDRESYPFVIANSDPLELDFRPMIREIAQDTLRNIPAARIASRFHTTLAESIAAVCQRIRSIDAEQRVCLSGGTFQNFLLLERTARALRNSGFEVFMHARVPPNDGGISLGQAVIANHRIQRGA